MASDTGPTILMVGNSRYSNRGCEAIVRGTVTIIRKNYPGARFLVATTDPEHDSAHEYDREISHIHWILPKWRPWSQRLRVYARPKKRIAQQSWLDFESAVAAADLVLSIGGDNYSLDYGIAPLLVRMGEYILKRHKRFVIWGASIGPFESNFNVKRRVLNHLRKVDMILVREPLTMTYLQENKIAEKVHLVADPAFLMAPRKPKDSSFMPPDLSKNDLFGINVSPIIARYRNRKDLDEWIDLHVNALRSLLELRSVRLFLIPHFTVPGKNQIQRDDWLALEAIYRGLREGNNRVFLAPKTLSAEEVKWAIRHCQWFYGCRTHATIASTSQGIPTIAVAYSVKARGIWKDIYGNTEWLIEGSSMGENDLSRILIDMVDKGDYARSLLEERIPTILDKALLAGELIKPLLGDCTD